MLRNTNVSMANQLNQLHESLNWKLTPLVPSWKPSTVMRTVSPTLALLGVMDSFGPFGAAKWDNNKKLYEKRGASKAENI